MAVVGVVLSALHAGALGRTVVVRGLGRAFLCLSVYYIFRFGKSTFLANHAMSTANPA